MAKAGRYGTRKKTATKKSMKRRAAVRGDEPRRGDGRAMGTEASSSRAATTSPRRSPLHIEIVPASRERWKDLVALFGERGACGGCWCMAWRKSSREFAADKGAANRASFEDLVIGGPPPGVLAMSGGEAIGWCSIAPREEFIRLKTSRTMKPLDAEAVWSISCLFVKRGFRRRGVSTALVNGAVAHARSAGAKIVEAYPSVNRVDNVPDAFVWTGVPETFVRAGFRVAKKASSARWIMRNG